MKPTYRYYLKTDVGQKRSQNQDAGLASADLGLFLVADGMGGHSGGEVASSTAAQVMSQEVQRGQMAKHWDPKAVLTHAIQKANQTIYHRASVDTKLKGMGTTLTSILFKDQYATIGHVGDSRCYYIKRLGMWQATRDHSYVQDKLKLGLITREQLKTDRMRNVITRSVGFESAVNVDLYEMQYETHDCFLICSDGLSSLVENPLIFEILERDLFEKNDIQLATEHLVEQANKNGGDDNVTALLVQTLPAE